MCVLWLQADGHELEVQMDTEIYILSLNILLYKYTYFIWYIETFYIISYITCKLFYIILIIIEPYL